MPRRCAATLAIYGAAHLLVDACCAAAAFHVATVGNVSAETFGVLLLLYHALAFAMQPLVGLAVDAIGKPRTAVVVGCLLTAAILAIPPSFPIAIVVIAGVGNALFHVGGGVVCLGLTPHRAAAPGVFVAPGSVGLLLGCVLGRLYPETLLPLGLTTVAICLPIAFSPIPRRLVSSTSGTWNPRTLATDAGMSAGDVVLGLILLSITARALLGFLVTFPWDTRPGELIILTLATCLGKALGGFVADRWGWRRIGVGATLASLPLLAASSTIAELAVPGLFLLNMTMPITLGAVAEALPGRLGFAFGLPCLALFLGMLPSLVGIEVRGTWMVVAILSVSATSLHLGLRNVASRSRLENSIPVAT